MIITSTSNDKIKDIKKLIKSAKERRERKLYVVEGIRMFKEIPYDLIEGIYVSESGWLKYKDDIERHELEPCVVSDKVFLDMSDTATPQGIMALVRYDDNSLTGLLSKKENPFVLITETIQDPGNMGTIIRTAEGAGADFIIVSKDSVDIYNPKTIRSTMGSIFRVPVYVSSDLEQDIELLKQKGVSIYAAHLNGDNFYNMDYRKGCGFLIGNEGNVLSEKISQKADKLIKIPMLGKVESLNAAMSTTIISYEVLRQRNFN